MQRVKLFVLVFSLISLACNASAASVSVPILSAPLPVKAESDPLVPGHEWDCEVIALEAVNVRGGPAVSWEIIRQLKRGEKVHAVANWKGWYMIGTAEWVNGRYLKCQ